MSDNLSYETYLFVSSNKFVITVISDSNENMYKEKLNFENYNSRINFDKLDYFLETNIFKIEKKLNNFVKKIFIILDLDVFIPIAIGFKKNNYGNNIDLNSLSHILYDAKDYCKKTINEKKIIHIIIDNYRYNDENYSFFQKDIKCNNFCLDIRFICLSIDLIHQLEKVLKKYQISLTQTISSKYINSFLSDGNKDVFLMAKNIIKGHNPNEVMLVDRTLKNQGFFERFFNFFN